jgi:hypothetical protein
MLSARVRAMLTSAVAVCLGAWAISSVAASEVRVRGRVLVQEELDLPPVCLQLGGLEEICLDTWFRWTLQIDHAPKGSEIAEGRLVAARAQHGAVLPSYLKRIRVFVLTPIEDPEQRRRLGADYYLQDYSGR